MRKILKSIILDFIILMGLLCICYQTDVLAATEDDFSVENGVIIKYTGNDSEVTIPSDVTAIGPGAFMESKLTTLTIPSNIKNIGEAAFFNCKELSRVNIEEGVTYIGNSAFADCPALYLINVPSSVKTLGLGVFADDISLSAVQINGHNYFCNEGAIYDSSSTKLIQYLAGYNSNYYEMPFSVKEIEKYAFWGAINLKYIRVSNNVAFVPAYAFSGCHNLRAVFLPESVKRVDDYAFYNCKDLEYLGTENSSVKIASTALTGCDEVKTYSGATENEANTMIVSLQRNERKKEAEKKKAEKEESVKKVELSGATGSIHNGEVTILDAIEQDRTGNYLSLDGEIGSGKTSDGNVSIFFDFDAQTIGTITPDMQSEREKAREALRKAKEEEAKRQREAEADALRQRMDDLRKNAFSNWKNK